MTNGIFGPNGSGLSEPASPPLFSESKSPPPPSLAERDGFRTCNRCEIEKPLSEFYGKKWKRHVCKACDRLSERQRKKQNPEHVKEAFRAWRAGNRGSALVTLARHRARTRGLPFDLDPRDIQTRIGAGHCEMTGIPFDLSTPRSWNAPSLDQITPGKGYTKENVRVVLYALNVMANTWGPQKIVDIANAILAKRKELSGKLSLSLGERLKEQLRGRGSTLFDLTWEIRATPAGLPYYQLVASARRTSDSDCGSWQTPMSGSNRKSERAMRAFKDGGESSPPGLEQQAQLASWPTPAANSFEADPEVTERRRQFYKAKHMNGNGFGLTTAQAAQLVGWPTPQSRDGAHSRSGQPERTGGQRRNLDDYVTLASWPTPRANDSPNVSEPELARIAAGERTASSTGNSRLELTAALASWATPAGRDWKDTPGMATTAINPDGTVRDRTDQLPRQAHGVIATGSPAQTEKRGQLNPEFSLWLMGFPPEWASSAPQATRLSRKSQQNLSKQQ